MSNKQGFVYIITNAANSVLYVGVTSDLQRRATEHRAGTIEGFTKKYHCTKLVYFGVLDAMYDAISREKQLKGGSRAKKIALIESENQHGRISSKRFGRLLRSTKTSTSQ